MSATTTYGYAHGLLASITDANGNVTSYGYDVDRRLSSTTFPDSSVERYTYTLDDLLYQKTDRKGQTLTVVNRDEAKTRAIPVRIGNDPAAIPEVMDEEIPEKRRATAKRTGA